MARRGTGSPEPRYGRTYPLIAGLGSGRSWGVPVLILFGLVGVVLVRTAWLCDDAYITFRTIENAASGLGLRWNAAERVQAFTHPLWLGVLLGPYSLTREMFLTPIVVSIATSLAAVALIPLRIAASRVSAAWAVTVLLFSRAFVDYSTSGLENPLTNLLLAAFVAAFLGHRAGVRKNLLLGFLAGLVALSRLDAVLLVLPAIAYELVAERAPRSQGALVLGFLPLVLWELFSVAYYGFPFPNTAYAKLGTGLPAGDLALQGLRYLGNSLSRDPVTLPAVLVGVLVALRARDLKAIMLAGGLALYLVYIVRIGGDFMAGRFLCTPLFLAVLVVAAFPPRGGLPMWASAFGAAVLLSVSAPYPPIATGRGFGAPDTMEGFLDEHGIGDERRFYYQDTGLLRYRRDRPMPTHRFAEVGRELRRKGQQGTEALGSVGMRGYFAGPAVHIVDQYALADPLLARLPAVHSRAWRIGHFLRAIPAGYSETAGTPRNEIQDPGLAQYYDRLRLVVSGPIFTLERWRAILDLNLGLADHLINELRYRYPKLRVETLARLSATDGSPPTGPESDRPALSADGLFVLLGAVHSDRGLVLEASSGEEYEVLFLIDGETTGRIVVKAPEGGGTPFSRIDVRTPSEAVEEGFDALHILPLGEPDRSSIRRVLLPG